MELYNTCYLRSPKHKSRWEAFLRINIIKIAIYTESTTDGDLFIGIYVGINFHLDQWIAARIVAIAS